MSFIVITEWASAPAIIPVEPVAPVVMRDIVVAPSGIVRETPISPVVVFIPQEEKTVGFSFPVIRVFRSMPTEPDLRFPAEMQNGKWVLPDGADLNHPKAIHVFELVGVSGYADGKYISFNAGETGPFTDIVQKTE